MEGCTPQKAIITLANILISWRSRLSRGCPWAVCLRPTAAAAVPRADPVALARLRHRVGSHEHAPENGRATPAGIADRRGDPVEFLFQLPGQPAELGDVPQFPLLGRDARAELEGDEVSFRAAG
jgi:hypothetical protein